MTGLMDPPVPPPPVVLPPDFDGGERPADSRECPDCRFPTSGMCLCGYDWSAWAWRRTPPPRDGRPINIPAHTQRLRLEAPKPGFRGTNLDRHPWFNLTAAKAASGDNVGG